MLRSVLLMAYSKKQLWERFQKYYTEFPSLGLGLDLSRLNFADDFFSSMQPRLEKAFAAMKALEAGAIANPDEKRMVGHYWLRNPALAPSAEIRREIEETISSIKDFAGHVHSGYVQGEKGPFKNILLIGIGGSALGPQFVASALGNPATDRMRVYFFDNTDPDGIDKTLSILSADLDHTLCIVVSKSGGTKETRNGMLEAEAAYKRAGLDFGRHALAVTSRNSDLDKYASQHGWLNHFPMWDWVGGRTSELSAVGLLPAALQGLDIDGLLAGAKACDEVTRGADLKANPSAQLALAWFYSGNGKGSKNMVVLPYKDRLELFSKYLQQLIMESLGKELDLNGNIVNQGITVLGNKGSTDQHSYIQQLRDGLNNFFVTFIRVLRDRVGESLQVEPQVTSGDYLHGFLLGTRQALYEKDRESVTITINEVSPFSVGVLIALFERTVGLYASLVNVNAYHQPGVEAGKKAASALIELQFKILALLKTRKPQAFTASEIAREIAAADEVESVFMICEHLAANSDRGVHKELGGSPFTPTYRTELSS
jgi:glucose-6-phosphate isomerase